MWCLVGAFRGGGGVRGGGEEGGLEGEEEVQGKKGGRVWGREKKKRSERVVVSKQIKPGHRLVSQSLSILTLSRVNRDVRQNIRVKRGRNSNCVLSFRRGEIREWTLKVV